MRIDVAHHRRRWPLFVAVLGGAVIGCQHQRANQYSYAPPLAPPVYPQPQQGAGPVVFGPPPAALPPPALPVAGAVPMAGPVAAPVFTGEQVVPQGMVVSPGDPCDPCRDGVVTAGPAFIDGGQTPPCP
jgi:hypothetical protein